MEEFINYITHIQQSSLDSEEYQAFLAHSNDEEFIKQFLVIILDQSVPLNIRCLAMIELKQLQFRINETLLQENFLPLLFDYPTQLYVFKLLPLDDLEFMDNLLKFVSEMVEAELKFEYADTIILIIENFVNKIHEPARLNPFTETLAKLLPLSLNLIYSDDAITLFFKIYSRIFLKNEDEDEDEGEGEENLESKQPYLDYAATLFNDLTEPLINKEDVNYSKLVKLIRRLICFIHETFDIEQKEPLKERFTQLLAYFHEMRPFDPGDYNTSTIIYYLFDYLFWHTEDRLDVNIIFDFIEINEQEFLNWKQNADSFFGDFFEGLDTDEADDDEPFEQIFSLHDWQSFVQNQIALNQEYSENLIRYMFEKQDWEKSILIKLTILLFCEKVNAPIALFPQNFHENMTEALVQYFYVRYFSFSIFSMAADQDVSALIQQLSTFYLPVESSQPFLYQLIVSDDPVLNLCAFDLITQCRTDLIHPELYVACLQKSLDLLSKFRFQDNVEAFIYKIAEEYFVLSESPENLDINNPLNSNPLCKLALSKSVFGLPDAIKDAVVQSIIYGPLLESIVNALGSHLDKPYNFSLLCNKIVPFFLGGEIFQLLDFNRSQLQFPDSESNYLILAEPFHAMAGHLIEHCISQQNYLLFDIFANVYADIKNENLKDSVNQIHELFLNPIRNKDDNNFELSSLNDTYDKLLRIFINYELYEGLDKVCLMLLNKNNPQFHIYLISFVLIHSKKYNPEVIRSILMIFAENLSQSNSANFCQISIILARVCMSNPELLVTLINDNLPNLSEDSPNEPPIKCILLKIASLLDNKFCQCISHELHRKLVICMYCAYNDSEINIFAHKFLCEHFIKMFQIFDPERNSICFDGSSINLVEETEFYSDAEFLSNAFILANGSQLIELLMQKGPFPAECAPILSEYQERFSEIF